MSHTVALILATALVTTAIRFAPFLILGGRQTPKIVSYLGKVLPFAVMGMLVVYCLRSVSFIRAPFGLPEIIGSLAVVLLHLWKRNTLISVGGGTAIYMIMVQMVFV